MKSIPGSAWRRATVAIAVLAVTSVAAGSAVGAATDTTAVKRARIAYLSFAVANSYDAPMLAAAQAVAKAQNASVTVFDAANDPKKQLAQLQTAITPSSTTAIIVQPIFGPQLIPTITVGDRRPG